MTDVPSRRGTSCSPTGALVRYRPELGVDHLDSVRSVRAVDAKTVRGRPAGALGGLARSLRRRPAAACARAARTSRRSGSNGSTIRERACRSEAARSSSTAWSVGRQLVLRRNPRYWGPHLAYLDRIVFRFTEPAGRLRTPAPGGGRHDRSGPRLFHDRRRTSVREERARGVRIITTLDSTQEHVDIQLGPRGHPALRNTLVRQALAYGIDREEHRTSAENSRGDRRLGPSRSTASYLLTNKPALTSRTGGGTAIDRTHARRLLERAGCRRGADGIYVCAGQRLSLRFVTTAGSEPRKRIGRARGAQLRQSRSRDHPRATCRRRPLRAIHRLTRLAISSNSAGASLEDRGPLAVFGCQQGT